MTPRAIVAARGPKSSSWTGPRSPGTRTRSTTGRSYCGDGALAHPGLLLRQANRALSENVALGPWVHAASDVVHCGPARIGDRLTTRGGPARLFERRGHAFVELDLLIVADDSRPVAWVRHTAIDRLRGTDGA